MSKWRAKGDGNRILSSSVTLMYIIKFQITVWEALSLVWYWSGCVFYLLRIWMRVSYWLYFLDGGGKRRGNDEWDVPTNVTVNAPPPFVLFFCICSIERRTCREISIWRHVAASGNITLSTSSPPRAAIIFAVFFFVQETNWADERRRSTAHFSDVTCVTW